MVNYLFVQILSLCFGFLMIMLIQICPIVIILGIIIMFEAKKKLIKIQIPFYC